MEERVGTGVVKVEGLEVVASEEDLEAKEAAAGLEG